MMQIGILQCDEVRSSLVSEFGEYSTMIQQRLAVLDKDFKFKIYKAHEGVLPECINACDAYILTGSRHSVFDAEILWINSLMNFIVRLNKAQIKTIGICFGHQLIATTMGGKVERADCGWLIGIHETKILEQKSFMYPIVNRFHVAMMCEDQIQTLPESATVLASSQNCQYAMLQYNKHMLSFQGHPEFSKDFAKQLLNIRQEEFPSKRYEVGSQSFSLNALDGKLLFQWIDNFLKQ